jgi:hypothetical protein
VELRDGLQASVVEMHVHTTMASSDSMLDPHDLVRIARENTLTAVNITEHDQVIEPHQQAAFREEHEDFFVNFGMEVSTDMGHMIAVGLRTYLPGIRRAEELRAALDELGGFLIVAHPFRRLFDPVTAMRTGEKFELTAQQAAEQLPVFQHVHAIEVANGANTPQENEFAYEVSQILGIPGTGGSDAHSITGIGAFATGFEQEVDSPERFLEELHAGRFEAVHRSNTGRWIKFEAGSSEGAKQDG